MNLYIYAKSGHQVGLDSVKRAIAIYKKFEEFDPTLLVSDFRAGEFAKNFGIKKYIFVDVAGNISNVAYKNDILIYDSNEINENLLKEMINFFSLFIRVDQGSLERFDNEIFISQFTKNSDIYGAIIDEDYYKYNALKSENKYNKALFFGDDDYLNILIELIKNSENIEIPLLLGHYFLLNNEDILEQKFKTIVEDENYEDFIKETKYLLTTSPQTVFESIASGNYPVYFQRADKTQEYNKIIQDLNIPIISGQTIDELLNNFEKTISEYPKIKSISTVVNQILELKKSKDLVEII